MPYALGVYQPTDETKCINVNAAYIMGDGNENDELLWRVQTQIDLLSGKAFLKRILLVGQICHRSVYVVEDGGSSPKG